MADRSKLLTMGLPPKYGKTGGIWSRKRSMLSSWLTLDVSSSSMGTQFDNPIHRRTASDSSLANTLKLKPINEVEKNLTDADAANKLAVADVKNKKIVDNSSDEEGFSIKTEPLLDPDYSWDRKIDANMDPKKIKRILANRLSAQRSRIRKMEYLGDLEKIVNSLQEKVLTISPQVSYYDRKRRMLRMENSLMKQRISALIGDKIFKDAQTEALKEERERLKQLQALLQLQQLQQQQMQYEQLQQQQQGDPMLGLETGPDSYLNLNQGNSDPSNTFI